jgi:hypothetical protein
MKTKHYTIEGPNDDCCQNWFQAHIICHTARTIAYAGANYYTMLIRFGDVEQKLQSTQFRYYIICFCSAQWLDIGSQPVKISLGTSHASFYENYDVTEPVRVKREHSPNTEDERWACFQITIEELMEDIRSDHLYDGRPQATYPKMRRLSQEGGERS